MEHIIIDPKLIRALRSREITLDQLLRAGDYEVEAPPYEWALPDDLEEIWESLTVRERAVAAIVAWELKELQDYHDDQGKERDLLD